MTSLKIATYNIHKGFSHFNRRVVLHELRDRLRELDADIVFLQEVQGENTRHAERYHNYPDGAQHEFIAEEIWPHCAYGKNSVYEAGHHGNAILSRFPILQSLNMQRSGELGMHDVFHIQGGTPARSYPAALPLLRLDRIYVRGFNVLHSHVHVGGNWRRLSDHAALSAQLESI